MDNHLNNDFFKRLSDRIPAMKLQIAQKFGDKKAAGNGKLKQPPCLVCGRRFGSQIKNFIIHANNKPEAFCPKCQKQLDDGLTALVNLGATRYYFVRFKDEKFLTALEVKFSEFKDCKLPDVVGKLKTVSDRFLDFVEHTHVKSN